ncbi:MAG TPA: GyrI-like domain-containing protein [Candidatus Pullichristensenella stercorigallinarum]|uniref:GyrI-like domain-containing protein n=1 Tax=Candidatus Pullichristensenella stercorigallinarum TaxID=2840909 RepID=A0A9D0ZNT5_9FIRM|nr:GyrI-like domain-containing protein [Candidatus Pullichristensenella stercorigallinarum]
MAFDYKKEYREFYLPPKKPAIAEVPLMRFVAVRGQGNPNEEGGAYQRALNLLYGLAYTVKMSKMGDHRMEGYFDYVVPPLEGLWWQEGTETVDLAHKTGYKKSRGN